MIVQIKDDRVISQNVGCRDEQRIRQYLNSRIQQALTGFREKELRWFLFAFLGLLRSIELIFIVFLEVSQGRCPVGVRNKNIMLREMSGLKM